MRSYSRTLVERVSRTAGDAPLTLLEITHADLTAPVRVVNDTQDCTSGGHLFVGVPFSLTMPDEADGQLSRARLAVDNVGRELVGWIDASAGALGAQCRIMQVLRDAPDVIEWEITMDMGGISIDTATVGAALGFDDLLSVPAVTMRYDQTTAPGMF